MPGALRCCRHRSTGSSAASRRGLDSPQTGSVRESALVATHRRTLSGSPLPPRARAPPLGPLWSLPAGARGEMPAGQRRGRVDTGQHGSTGGRGCAGQIAGRHLELAEALLEVRGILLDGWQGMRGPDRLPVKAVQPGHFCRVRAEVPLRVSKPPQRVRRRVT